ncbi:50S ribosomal protein L25/general stress protein Ctc [Rhodoferax sp. U2-2l]|uniref:50S ribosomal protein L25/general stress protein Ctc n=1 Tax=Rhodoferax sp. U2-2l TaxID=2884000 RepID=UPI001D0AFF83|nr:50S ribosomal protein L25/general stress protein Ctc [Rhodoferax sp. U2-2l]MCB8746922.1 50S ribosomal protein L25/general stress protein Ctc [Rhodoferax sp. U2-2l]
MNIVAFERAKQGTGASRRLRITGRTPGIVYGGAAQPQLIEVDHNALWHALKKEAFHSSILDMDIAGTAQKVLLRDVQVHPFKQLVLHVDFQRVDATTKLHMKVPLHFVGDDQSMAIKSEGCIANHVISEIDVLCLPADLPEFITVDLSGLRKGSSLHLQDVPMPKGVKAITHGSDKNPVVVSVVVVAAAEAPAEAAPAADAKPAGKGGKPAAKPAAKK